jgi:hypothetical protein
MIVFLLDIINLLDEGYVSFKMLTLSPSSGKEGKAYTLCCPLDKASP